MSDAQRPADGGRALPDFDLELTDGTRLTRDGLAGKRTLLYFYPKDNTPGCTIEGRDFSRLLDEFRGTGVDVLGVSPDSVKSHQKFTESCDLSVPLISDPDRLLCEALDVWVQKSMMGKKYMGVERSTFLVGPDGRVEKSWREVKAQGHAEEVLAELRARTQDGGGGPEAG
jgi:peroxiredoxin Q/BCP